MYAQYSKPERINLVIRQSLGVTLTVVDKLPALMRAFRFKNAITFLQCHLPILFSWPGTARDLAGWSPGKGSVTSALTP